MNVSKIFSISWCWCLLCVPLFTSFKPYFVFGQGDVRAAGKFQTWDVNKDGVLTREEVPAGPRRMFERVDTNSDGKITLEEHRSGGRQPDRNTPTDFDKKQNALRCTIRQAWVQEPTGIEREYIVRPAKNDTRSCPITILFHGNGGSAEPMIRNWDRTLTDHILVAAQGYENSWNITKERSKAPDVDFVEMIVEEVLKRYPQADESQISLIGSSNGAGMVYRLLIEMNDSVRIKNAIAFVSSLTESQYHDEQFWKRTDETTSRYDRAVELSERRRIITVHGSADSVVPYDGGRGPGGAHLSAQGSAYAWAVAQGYRGDKRPDVEGKPCGEKLFMYDYPEGGVTHIKVLDGRHGLGPGGASVKPLLVKMLGWSAGS